MNRTELQLQLSGSWQWSAISRQCASSCLSSAAVHLQLCKYFSASICHIDKTSIVFVEMKHSCSYHCCVWTLLWASSHALAKTNIIWLTFIMENRAPDMFWMLQSWFNMHFPFALKCYDINLTVAIKCICCNKLLSCLWGAQY